MTHLTVFAAAGRPTLRALVAVLLLAGCSIGDPPADGGTVADVAQAEATQQAELPGAPPTEAQAWHCPGGHGCACATDADCTASGLCLTDADNLKTCAVPCQQGACAAQFTCRTVATASKPGPWCVAKAGRLCDPCATSADCRDPGHPGAACVDYGSLGRYCGVACQGQADCGPGYTCRPISSIDSGLVLQCVREDGGAIAQCGCSPRAIADKRSTVCGVGTCAGSRSCGESGLSLCDGATPAVESCNGKDDDCDGQTDEPSAGKAICDDGKPCTGDACDPAKGCQNLPADGTSCNADGSYCTGPDTCKEGACVAGAKIDCDDKNPCTEDNCSALVGCQYTWAAGKACDDGDACTSGEACAQGGCIGKPKACDDKNPCTADVCVGGACTGTAIDGAPCNDGNACTGADTCALGLCSGATATCDDANACTADSCDKAKGCANLPKDPTACEDGNLCTTGDQCQGGVCAPGTSSPCTTDNPCLLALCSPASADCATKLRPDGYACSDGKPCTSGDACAKGLCAGKAACNDGNACTVDACGPDGNCAFAVQGAGACDDGDKCTSGDACAAGLCAGAAVPSLCDDHNPCTSDSCDKAAGCKHANASDGAACDDGLSCNGTDNCATGACTQHTSVCKACASDGDCAAVDDGNLCNGKAVCDKLVCTFDPKTVVVCDHSADTACSVNSCDGKTGKCAAVTLADGATCSDGSACTPTDACKGGACTGSGSCDDGNPCTADACGAQGCTHTAKTGTACDDASLCTTNDACTDKGVCAGTAKVCDDANSCTDDSCHPKTGCATANNTGSCQLPACKQGLCASGTCNDAGKTGCDDNNACTADACTDNACKFDPVADGGACTDSDACTTGEACKAGKCATTPVSCPDAATACQVKGCDSKTGCTLAADKDGAVCDDGSACTAGDACAAGSCKGTAKVCDDKNACTTDSCDAKTGFCTTAALDSGSCDDGNPCTNADACAKGSCAGSAKVCDDKDPCTADACDSKTGDCLGPAAADGTGCDDGDACTSPDKCAAGKCKGEIGADLVSTLAGAGEAGFANGTGSQAKFSEPVALAIDASGTLYVADAALGGGRIRKVTPLGAVTTFAGQGPDGFVDGGPTTARFWRPSGLAFGGDGALYVADRFSQRIRKVDSDGTVSTLAGEATADFGDPKALGDFADGQGKAAKFDEPAGIAWSPKENALLVVEAANHRVRKVALDGTVTLFAGKGGIGSADGDALQATFNAPTGIAVDSDGAVYVSDSGNHRIRKIAAGKVSTYAGSTKGYKDEVPLNSLWSEPAGLAFGNGVLVVADAGNGSVRTVAFTETKTLAGNGTAGYAEGAFADARFKGLRGVVVGGTGLWYVADSENFRVRKLVSPKAACGK